jgi:ubiquinone/menaquinone biosynthesis C-methylase UbiE
MVDESPLNQVKKFWDAASCGEALYLKNNDKASYQEQSQIRYQLEPDILSFAQFYQYKGKQVLEIGVGLGADHQQFAEHGALLHGIDLTPHAIEHVKKRFELFSLSSDLRVANAEKCDFDTNSFDLVYSWGVIHHSPNTEAIVNEIYRILKPGAKAKVMIYHKYSLVGYMLWVRYALLKLRPWTSLKTIYAKHLESPGTKAYSINEAKQLFSAFDDINIHTHLTHGDLLSSNVGQKHRGMMLTLAKKIWPRWFFKSFFKRSGLFMMIEATKPSSIL